MQTEFEGLPDKNLIYRGMSAEEYANIVETGKIESAGTHNIGDAQNGLTYFTTDPTSAQSYANGFAPVHFKPTLSHPAYIVAVEKPQPDKIRNVKGTGSHEVGVIGSLPADDIVAVWRGRVYNQIAEPYNFSPVTYYDHMDRAVTQDDTHRVRYGGYSAQVVWERIF